MNLFVGGKPRSEHSIKAYLIFPATMSLALACAIIMLGYGGLVWGLLPLDASISWDGHLAGLAAGVGSAKLLHTGSHEQAG